MRSALAATKEPGLLYRTPRVRRDLVHDYDPSWDYEIDESPPKEAAALATAVAKNIYAQMKIPFELWAIKNEPDAVAVYVYGTSGFPVVLIDLRAHKGYEDQIGQSIRHELKHAEQEAEGRDFDEDEAEHDN